MPPITENKNKKKCFIIMPISTPDNRLSDYSNDKNHFKHVLEHLLIPSIEKAGLESIPPIAKGAEIIHGNIIKNIESADLVLCDMSTLNPNVFFELGIRIAINKPVCLIKDDLTEKGPFDTAIIYCHPYLSALNQWTSKNQIEGLSNHIIESLEGSNGSKSLWNYFSLSSPAKPVEGNQGVEVRIDYLTKQIEALREQLSVSSKVSVHTELNQNIEYYIALLEEVCDTLSKGLDNLGVDNPSAIKFQEALKLLVESLDQLEIIIKNSGLTPKELSNVLEFMKSLSAYDPR